MRAAKALKSLCICTDTSELSLFDDARGIKISCAGLFVNTKLL